MTFTILGNVPVQKEVLRLSAFSAIMSASFVTLFETFVWAREGAHSLKLLWVFAVLGGIYAAHRWVVEPSVEWGSPHASTQVKPPLKLANLIATAAFTVGLVSEKFLEYSITEHDYTAKVFALTVAILTVAVFITGVVIRKNVWFACCFVGLTVLLINQIIIGTGAFSVWSFEALFHLYPSAFTGLLYGIFPLLIRYCPFLSCGMCLCITELLVCTAQLLLLGPDAWLAATSLLGAIGAGFAIDVHPMSPFLLGRTAQVQTESDPTVSNVDPSEIDKSYQTLNLSSTASLAEVVHSFKDLRRMWHPEYVSHNQMLAEEAQRRWTEIFKAYNIAVRHAFHKEPHASTPVFLESYTIVDAIKITYASKTSLIVSMIIYTIVSLYAFIGLPGIVNLPHKDAESAPQHHLGIRWNQGVC